MASLAEHSAAPPRIFISGDALTPNNDSGHETERGRLKRRRLSSHSPPRAPSPSRGHERDSGSRHRHHHRKHHRASSSSSVSPPPHSRSAKKNRRRSDAEPDHTLRGRARNRSESRSRSPILEGDEREVGRQARKRSAPPSRHRGIAEEEGEEDAAEVRRQRSFPNLYKRGSRAGKEDGEGKGERMEGVRRGGDGGVYEEEKGKGAPAVQEV